MATATQPRGLDLPQVAYALAAVAAAAIALSGSTAITTAAAIAVCLLTVITIASARDHVGHTIGAIRSWLLDPFLPLSIAAVLAAAHGVAATSFPPGHPSLLVDGLLLGTGLTLCLGLMALLRERLRSHALELTREAVFVAAIVAITAWLARLEAAWVSGELSGSHAILGLAGAAVAFTAFILGGRLAGALGARGRWFLAGPAALALTGVFGLMVGSSIPGNWERASSAASLAATALLGATVARRGLVRLRTTVAVAPSRVGFVRLAVVLAGVLLVPTVSIVRLITEVEVSVPSLAASTAVLSVAAVAYLAGLARDWGRLERRAQHDELTGLPNRRHFIERLALAVADASGNGLQPAVMFCDLDRFKVVNDSLGHATGNQLLVAIADRLVDALPADALAARLGGDEFAILLADADEDHAMAIAETVRSKLALPVEIQGRTLHIGASIGVARYPDDGVDPDVLVRAADTAMYRAKDLGRGRAAIHSDELREQMESRFALETDLHHAIERGQLHLVYQPRVDLVSGEIVGAEALLRWHHPALGSISPSRFIPVAEETGLIREVGLYALEQACRQLYTWETAGIGELVVSVNLSARQFELDRMADAVASVLRRTGADPIRLELELTESLAHSDIDEVTNTLADLADMGIRCSIDDFGTGYSGLSYLGRFPLHGLKIDRGFIQAIDAQRGPNRVGDPASVVAAVIALGRSFGLRVIAEGVETHEQLRFVLDHGCDEMQGHLFSPPVDVESFETLLRLERHGNGIGRLAILKSMLAAVDLARDGRHDAIPQANVIAMDARRFGRGV